MTFERGELLLVPFPFTDLSAAKLRPVLALTQIDRFGDFIGLPVTSRPSLANALPISTSDLVSGSLPVASWIRTDRVVALSATLVVKSIARLPIPLVDAAIDQLCGHLRRP